MAKEPDLSPRDKAIPKPAQAGPTEKELEKEKKKDRKHYPQYEYMITSGFASMNPMGAEGWVYVDLWDANSSITTQEGITRRGSDPFIIWQRELD